MAESKTSDRRPSADERAAAAEQREREHRQRGPHRWHVGRSFVALHPISRGVDFTRNEVLPGDPIDFSEDEGEHVTALLNQNTIVEGRPGEKHVADALAAADRARREARDAHNRP